MLTLSVTVGHNCFLDGYFLSIVENLYFFITDQIGELMSSGATYIWAFITIT